MKKNILCFFRAGLGDFYLSFPLFYTLRNTYKTDKITLVAPLLAADLLHGKEWFNRIVSPEQFVPERKYDVVYDLDMTRTGRTAIFNPRMDYFDVLESTHNVSFGDRTEFPKIFQLKTSKEERKRVEDLIAKHSNKSIPDSKNVVLHTTHTARIPKGKTPPSEWWSELISMFPQHRFFQVGTSNRMSDTVCADFDFTGRTTNVINQKSLLNLREVAYLIEKTDFHISVDSIVQHLSLSAGPKRGMVILGSSDSKLATHEHNYNVSSNRPCSPCIDSTNNPNCCLIQNPKLFPTIDRVTRILRENFLLSQPKKSGWLIEDEINKKNIPKVL